MIRYSIVRDYDDRLTGEHENNVFIGHAEHISDARTIVKDDLDKTIAGVDWAHVCVGANGNKTFLVDGTEAVHDRQFVWEIKRLF